MNDSSETKRWVCEQHGVEYGDTPDGGWVTQWECQTCVRECELLKRAFHAEHARFQWWQSRSGVPWRYRAACPARLAPLSPSAKTLATAVSAYAKGLEKAAAGGKGMLLLGPPGLGKTLSLCALINEACKLSTGAVYAHWPDTLSELKIGFSGSRDDPRREAVARLRDAPLLGLDELGVRGMSDFDHNELFQLIDYRYREGLATLVAANATPGNFPTLVGERVADRLREMGPTIVLVGESARGKTDVGGQEALKEPSGSIGYRVHCMGAWSQRKFDAPNPQRHAR